MEQLVEGGAVGGHDLGVVLGQFVEKEHAEHAALAVAAERHALGLGRGGQTFDQRAGGGREVLEEAGLLDLFQCRQSAGGGHGVAAQGAGLIDAAQRGQLFHDVALGTEGRQRHAAADDLAHDGHVGFEAGDGLGIDALRAAQRHAEAGHDLVEREQGAMLGAQLPDALHERHGGAHEVHVARDGLDDDAGHLVTVLVEGGFDLFDVVVFKHHGVLHHLRWHARAGGGAERGQARTGFHQQGVGMAVVAAFELDDLLAAGGAARQADGAHAGFGARADQAHHVDAGDQLDDLFGQLDFALGGSAERESLEHRFLHRFHHRGVAVTQDHRAPGADVVDVLLPVGVPKVSALGTLHKTRRAAHGLEGAHGRVHATGDQGFGAVEEGLVAVGHGERGGCHWAKRMIGPEHQGVGGDPKNR